MSTDFVWECFDDEDEDLTGGNDEIRTTGRRQRFWLMKASVLLILLIAAGIGMVAWLTYCRRLIETDEALLRAIVELELRAIADGDSELFVARQDPSDSRWRERQVARYLASSAAGFSPAPGLAPANRPTEIGQVQCIGHSGKVELVHWFEAEADLDSGLQDVPLPFRTTWYYARREDGTWYHITEPKENWGTPFSWRGKHLTIRAPNIEAEELAPIAEQLDRLLDQNCEWLNCAEGVEFVLSFEDVLAPQSVGQRWAMPALSYAGLPEDETARAAWQRALARWLVHALVQAHTAPDGLKTAWSAHASDQGWERNAGLPTAPSTGPWEPPILATPPTVTGNQIAMICDQQIWTGDLQERNLVRLTAEHERFDGLHWSPDGQWLFTAWQPGDRSGSALYLLSADGREGRLLPSDPDVYPSPTGWSPDGTKAIYLQWSGSSPGTVRSVEVATGRMDQLTGHPVWSPTGEQAVYFEAASETPTGSIWLAGGEGDGARLIAERVLATHPTAHWSPDGGRLTFTVLNETLDESSIVVYDLGSGRLVPFLEPSGVLSHVASFESHHATDATRAGIREDDPPEVLLPLGWSADGQQLLVSARWAHSPVKGSSRAILAIVPGTTNGPLSTGSAEAHAPHTLAFTAKDPLRSAAWSPTDPDRLVYPGTCRESACQVSWAYIHDQATGTVPIYELPIPVEEIHWSPDGAWMAFVGGGEVVIVDKEGQNRWVPWPGASCFDMAWNPVFDATH